MNTRQLTCEERIGDSLARTLQDLRGLTERIDIYQGVLVSEDAQKDAEDARAELDDYPLCLMERRTKIIQLSWGGPADQLEYELYDDGSIRQIRYRFMDWGDGATRVLHGDDYVLAERLYHEWMAE